MTKPTASPARRLAVKIALTGLFAALPLGLAAGPALAAGTHAGSCNIDGNVKWVKDCPND
ncbi:hypothetical protein [Rhodococcus sp. NPDC059234]|uniref:hypothetical protein n=1 Tax=Rhodococcus sp. NPDC059234 TaxID=3346781 RepID=UPI00366C2228